MKTLGLLMMAAAATGSGGIFDGLGKPHASNSLFRPHVVQHGPPPASGPIMAPPVDPGLSGAGFGAGGPGGRMFANTTSQIFFVDPADMQITWQTPGPDGMPIYLPPQLTVPARYNFKQGFIYRLKLANIADNPGLVLYPTIEVAPGTPQTDAYLTHNPIPVQFTQEDFDQVRAGNFVTKVVYLPDPRFQELAVAGLYGAETLVSTRLEPGVDPVLEADKRGTILMIVRVGAIDLEMPTNGTGVVSGPVMTAPAVDGGAYAPGGVIYSESSGMLPPPEAMTPPVAPTDPLAPPVDQFPLDQQPIDQVPLDQPPVSPATPDFGGDQQVPVAPPADDIPTTGLPPTEPAVTPAAMEVPPLPEPVAPPAVGDDLPGLLP